MEQMQGLDAAFAALETSNAPVHVGSIFIYDPSTSPNGFVRFKDIISFIENRLQLSKSLRRKMVKVPFNIDYPYWVEDADFDLEYHLRHVALPKPGDWRQLCIQAARIFARPLDLSRPPWEITVIEGLDNIEGVPKGSYALLAKVHHVAIDGISGVDLMHATHTLRPDEEPLTTPDKWRPDPQPSQVGLLARGYMKALTLPIRQGKALWQSTPGAYRAVKGLVKKDYDLKAIIQTPKTRFNGCISPHRVFGAQLFKLKEVLAMRALCEGAKMNDVMLSVCGGAMRRYLEAKNELPAASMTAMAPISVRTDAERNTMGNQIAAMFVPVGSHINDVNQRLKYVVEETVKAKKLTNNMGARQISDIAKLAPAPAMQMGANVFHRFNLADKTKPLVSTVVTNVPGPPVALYSAGARAVAVYGMLCLIDGVRLGHIVHTFMDDVTLSFTACREAMPDPEFYDECIKESYAEHKLALEQLQSSATISSSSKSKANPQKAKTTKKTPIKTSKSSTSKRIN